MKFDLMRMGIVYLHLIACCVALGTVFMSDLQLVKGLMRSEGGAVEPNHLAGLHHTLARALLALWVTGFLLVAVDVWRGGTNVLFNPKLQAKFAVVLLLTVNGLALERFVLPAMKRAGALMRLSFSNRLLAVFIGAVSAVSWFYAAALGVGRPLNWQFSLAQIMAAWPILVAGGFFMMITLTAWAQYTASGGAAALQRVRFQQAH
ncbi:hypothetical protein [Ramlibacter sp. Leaf400]|uniref:hypothetical protein n=1 Tax=Ramlibacter sp. Leaf400 TaxID=1736365 RepID=UPI0006F840FC|nr:hypothetical protein [Ramlibacter sp. Leaf400]KQT10941.1 hypothetical protein ASG30_09070 [Ramlibacter sp. Leaf400]